MSEYGRRVRIRITVDIWSWPGASLSDTIDITNDILNYRFQKTIKAPQGSCQLSVLPQSATTHIMDIIKPMDVVKIYEFGELKFLGYITRVSYTGAIGGDGKPQRNATITCQQFGGLLTTASIGIGLGTAMGLEDSTLFEAATALSLDIIRASDDGVTFSEMVSLVINSFITYLQAVNASEFVTYVDQYLDVTSGLTGSEAPALPRTFELFSGNEESLTVWQVLEQLVQRPFNELWIDSGNRSVHIEGQDVNLPEKACLVFRPTPFNGTIPPNGGPAGSAWDGMPIKNIPADLLLRFDLARSMDEVYTFYSVKEPAFQFSDFARLLLGQAIIDENLIGKYLMKPLITELFYTRVETVDGDDQEITSGQALTAAERAATTLFNWFSKNEEFLSGSLQIMVPEDGENDPRIGERISVYGIEGTFYVEGIAHTWQYQGPLKSDITITRGYNNGSKIELKDRIFRRNPIR